ncbi:MAG: S41 family peptidase [Clostridia bacterium]|nr:S41 family peptidase [Clostridia bacterium]
MNSKKTNNIYKYTIIIIITAFITFILTSTFVYRFINNDERYYIKNSKTESSSLEQTLSYFKEILDKKYIGDINEEELKESAIKGYIAGLNDPYTEYFTKEEMKEFTEETEGEYVGIGIYTTADTKQNAIIVLRTIGDSPASKAGLLTGDIIKKVDEEEFTGEQLNEAVKKMKGIAGTNVKITVVRNDKEMEFNIKRENIKISHVSSNVLNDNIGYIKISSFEGGCSEEFLEKYKEIQKQNIKSLIIDLRFNGGGIVDEALNIAELMVPKDKILLITKDKTEEEDVVKAKKDASINMPVVVLVNEYSASASEILAGILKEDINATLIGNTTYGKGVIQTVYPLKDGSGLKITTDEYYTPNHNKINKVGIEPTIKIEISEELRQITNLPLEQDIQLQKAIEELK